MSIAVSRLKVHFYVELGRVPRSFSGKTQSSSSSSSSSPSSPLALRRSLVVFYKLLCSSKSSGWQIRPVGSRNYSLSSDGGSPQKELLGPARGEKLERG